MCPSQNRKQSGTVAHLRTQTHDTAWNFSPGFEGFNVSDGHLWLPRCRLLTWSWCANCKTFSSAACTRDTEVVVRLLTWSMTLCVRAWLLVTSQIWQPVQLCAIAYEGHESIS